MKIRAPFQLHIVATDTRAGQAQGEYWYLAPFRLWKRRVFGTGITKQGTYIKTSFEYDNSGAQSLGWLSVRSQY